MVIPVSDDYLCKSGGRIYAGGVYLPAWRQAMSQRTWAKVGSNTLSNVDPAADPLINPNHPAAAPWRGQVGQVGLITGWSGAVWDEANKRLMIVGGGHADYAGNETYEWDAATAQFNLLTRPTGSIGNTGTLNDRQEATGVYFDGQPRSFHSYYNFDIRNGEIWFFGGSAYYNGNFCSRPFKWNGTNWTRMYAVSVNAGSAGVTYDSNNDIFWVLNNGGTHQPKKFNPNTGAVTKHSGWFTGAATYARPHYNAAHDCLVIFTNVVYVMKATGDSVSVTTSGSAPSFNGKSGIQYDAANDRYLIYAGGTTIYVLTPPAGDPATETWVWSSITADIGNTVTPSSETANGTYGRFWHSTSLNCCGVVNATNQHMYVFALN